MPFIEIFVPAGTVRDDQRNTISSRVAAETNSAAGLPDTEAVRDMSWLVWRDLDHWFVAGAPASAGDGPRYAVRITMAGGSVTAEQRADLVTRIVKVLTDAHGSRPDSWVQFVETPRDNQCLVVA